jgi:hypothetical protein
MPRTAMQTSLGHCRTKAAERARKASASSDRESMRQYEQLAQERREIGDELAIRARLS